MHTMNVAVVFLVISGATAVAQQMPMPMNAGDLKWGPAPNVLPRGAQIAVVSGDPSKDALYVVRLKLPANYELPAHNHPTSEYVTVITGDFHIGMGDKLDRKNGLALQAGGFAEASAKMNHYALTFQRDRRSDSWARDIRNHICESDRRSEQEAVGCQAIKSNRDRLVALT